MTDEHDSPSDLESYLHILREVVDEHSTRDELAAFVRERLQDFEDTSLMIPEDEGMSYIEGIVFLDYETARAIVYEATTRTLSIEPIGILFSNLHGESEVEERWWNLAGSDEFAPSRPVEVAHFLDNMYLERLVVYGRSIPAILDWLMMVDEAAGCRSLEFELR